MNTDKILPADMLDLVFADRNKEYGAYELRRTYQKRITKALIFTGCITILAFGTVLATTSQSEARAKFVIHDSIQIENIPEPEQPLPEPERQPEPEPEREVPLASPVIAPDDQVETPPATQEEAREANIGIEFKDGVDPSDIVKPTDLDGGTNIVEVNNDVPQGPVEFVEVDAKFLGNWGRFLEKNLRGEVPIDNGAPVGRHRVIIRFVVDLDGSVSDITPMTNVGYGMEEEAIRVIKKATKWEPAMQNGHFVKAYRTQPIIFDVTEQ